MKNLKKSLILLLAIALLTAVVFSLVACNPNGGGGDDDDIIYTVSVQRSGGYGLKNVNIRVFDDANELVASGFTNKNGKAVFPLSSGNYTVKIHSGLPEGYTAQSSYSMTAQNHDLVIKLSASLLTTPMDENTTYELGSVMHDFSFTDTRGVNGSLASLLDTYKAVVINFWYTTCTYCVQEFPGMQQAYVPYKDDLVVLGLNYFESSSVSEDFRANMGLSFTMVGNDVPSTNSSITAIMKGAFGVTGCPTTIIVDREGVVCYIDTGAIDKDTFTSLFDYYTNEDYVQKIWFPEEQVIEKPNIPAPSAQAFANAINADGYNGTYTLTAADDEYNWPWIICEDSKTVQPSNKGKNNSHSYFTTTVAMTTDQVLTFEYKTSTEKVFDYGDQFYVIVNDTLIHLYAGVMDDFATCYAYVPAKDGDYTITIGYTKDQNKSAGEDTVYIKNMRFVSPGAIDAYTEIVRPCSTGENEYIIPVYNPADNYYHVGNINGPLILADLMNPTIWAENAWETAIGDTDKPYYEDFATFCRYANNSRKYGLLAVTKELYEILNAGIDVSVSKYTSGVIYNHSYQFTQNTWLKMCKYYSVYGSSTQVPDPVLGMTPYAAYDAVVNTGDAEHPVKNHVNKETLMMPRGMWYKFVPEETSVYSIHSIAGEDGTEYDTFAWLRDENGEQITENDDNPLAGEDRNFFIPRVLYAGTTYYICVDFNNVDILGEFDFVIDKYNSGVYWTLAAEGYGWETTPPATPGGEPGLKVALANAVKPVLNPVDHCYYVDNGDGTMGSKIYISICDNSTLFPDMSIERMLGIDCYVCLHCGSKYHSSVAEFERNDDPICAVCGNHGKSSFSDKKNTFDLPTPQREANNDLRLITIRYEGEGEDGLNDYYHQLPLYVLDTTVPLSPANYVNSTFTAGDILTYGIKFTSYHDIVASYVELSKTDYPSGAEIFDANAKHKGYVAATEELVEILKKLIIFGDYAFNVDIENAWLLLACYYMQLG